MIPAAIRARKDLPLCSAAVDQITDTDHPRMGRAQKPVPANQTTVDIANRDHGYARLMGRNAVFRLGVG